MKSTVLDTYVFFPPLVWAHSPSPQTHQNQDPRQRKNKLIKLQFILYQKICHWWWWSLGLTPQRDGELSLEGLWPAHLWNLQCPALDWSATVCENELFSKAPLGAQVLLGEEFQNTAPSLEQAGGPSPCQGLARLTDGVSGNVLTWGPHALCLDWSLFV